MICVFCGQTLYMLGDVPVHPADLPPILPRITRSTFRPPSAA